MKMNKLVFTVLSLLMIFTVSPLKANAAEEAPVPFIIDTDFSSDVDDALAMSVACYYQDAGLIDIRGVALCCTSTNGAYAMSALLTQHGYPNIPICADWDDGLPIGSKYHQSMLSYSHNTSYYSDTVSFYRMLLSQSDEKVTIVTLGELTNLYLLLTSEPDAYSPLTGAELMTEKVERIYLVAGKSNGGLENNIWYCGDESIPTNRWKNGGARVAAKYVGDNCPVPMVWMEADLIGGFAVGDFLCSSDKYDILSQALTAYGTEWGSYSFDPFGIMIAALDSNELLDTLCIQKVQGTMHVTLDGTSYFADGVGLHSRIVKGASDNWYKTIINSTLQYEFNKRHGKV